MRPTGLAQIAVAALLVAHWSLRTRLAFDHRDCPVGADRWQLDELPVSVDEILLCGTPEDEPKGGIAKRSSQCLTEFPGRKRLR